jgi:hypothetical protein
MHAMNSQLGTTSRGAMQAVSPLVLADRLLSLAADAERSGLHRPAERLLRLAFAVYDEKPEPV